MNNIIKFTMAAGILALMGCSGDSVSGAAIEGNAIAKNSSSSVANNSSDSMNGFNQIVFSTKATEVRKVDNADISIYGEENGAEVGCTADEKSYEAKIKVNNGLVENTIEMKNFGSACDSVLTVFVASCQSRALVFNGSNNKESCDENGNVKVYCYDDRAVSMGVCTETNPGTCTTIPAETTVDFNEIFKSLSNFSGEVCSAIFKGASSTTGRFSQSSTSRDMSSSSGDYVPPIDPIDSNGKCIEETGKKCGETDEQPVVAPRQEMPSYSAVGIDTNANRSFVVKPNVEALNVSDAERSVLDSLARAFPAKSEIDAFGGLTAYDAARWYVFSPSTEKYYVGAGTNRCKVDVIRDEYGLKRDADWSIEAYGGSDVAVLDNTILQYSDSVIVYLVAGSMTAAERESAETLFRTECESTAGSFYDYPSKGMWLNVGMACAVKNFSGITFDALLGQQADLCENAYVTIAQPVLN